MDEVDYDYGSWLTNCNCILSHLNIMHTTQVHTHCLCIHMLSPYSIKVRLYIQFDQLCLSSAVPTITEYTAFWYQHGVYKTDEMC